MQLYSWLTLHVRGLYPDWAVIPQPSEVYSTKPTFQNTGTTDTDVKFSPLYNVYPKHDGIVQHASYTKK